MLRARSETWGGGKNSIPPVQTKRHSTPIGVGEAQFIQSGNAIVDVMYSDNNFKCYKGMRVMAIDGSKIV